MRKPGTPGVTEERPAGRWRESGEIHRTRNGGLVMGMAEPDNTGRCGLGGSDSLSRTLYQGGLARTGLASPSFL